MNGQRKPRRVRWPASVNTLNIALQRATKFTPAEIAKRLDPLREALTMLRCGMANEQHWQCLASAVAVSLSIGLIEHLTTADTTLQAIKARCTADGGWTPTALDFYEIEAMATYVSLFAFQLSELSAQEYDQAFNHAVAETQRVQGVVIKVQRSSFAPA
jgi:hypothetical protein